jgi:hypothetical protein
VEVQIRLLRLKKYKNWGAKKILVKYMALPPGKYVTARSTIEELFKREGFTKNKEDIKQSIHK